MQMARPAANLNYALFIFVGIGLSAFVLVSSDGGKAAVVEKVHYTVLNYFYGVSKCPRFKSSIDSHLLVYCKRFRMFLSDWNIRERMLPIKDHHFYYNDFLPWKFNLTCWFIFQCPIECQCNLTAIDITITCPDGLSIAEVKYPSGYWSTSSSDRISGEVYNKTITIYFWYNAGLNSITQGAFIHLQNISDCYLIVSWNNIKDIQERQFEELSKLRGLFLDNNKIVSLHRNAFIGLNSLVHLHLQQNEIVGLFPNLFQELANLEYLFIDGNNIKMIGQQDFRGLDKLEILDIGYNKIVKIHSRGFKGLKNLGWLYLDHNNITTIHPYVFQDLAQLSWLYLHGNRISEINSPLNFQNLTGLFGLYLKRNTISDIHPLQFQNLNKLTILILARNTISVIHPLQFQNLLRLEYLYLSHNLIHKIHPLQFQNLTRLYLLDLDHNEISEIHPLQFHQLSSLTHLIVSRNMISEIHRLQFQSLSKLSNVLSLAHNTISELHPLQFQNLNKLTKLNLDHNTISVIHPLQFEKLARLFTLTLNHNLISEIHPLQFQKGLRWLEVLSLGYNNISEIPPNLFPKKGLSDLTLSYNNINMIPLQVFQNLLRCFAMYLDHNEITELHPKQFQSIQLLTILDLSYNNLVEFTLASSTVKMSRLGVLLLSNNKLRTLSYTILHQSLSLEILNVSGNQINMINSLDNNTNNSIAQIQVLDLRQNNLYFVNHESFSKFYNVTVFVDNNATCCFITTAHCYGTIPRSQFLTCGRLLPNQIQRVNMWILGLFAILSNFGVLIYRYRNKEKENKVQLLLISNLSISDMIMGIYIMIITSADLYYKRMFPSELWRVSFTCKFAGTLSVLSSEASVFFVTLISLDRLIGIRYPFSTYRFGTKTSRILSLVLWLTAISISILSTILSSVNHDWYDVSEVCTGLPLSRKNVYENKPVLYSTKTAENVVHLTRPRTPEDEPGAKRVNGTETVVTGHQPGMYFGIAIFIVLNFICFIVISVCYTGIFVATIQTAKKAGRARDNKQERKMAMKMGAIVISDLACWAPIIILSILVQSGRHIVTPHVYTWIVTFVLPINSAINPFLYTLAALIFDFIKKKKQSLSTVSLRNVST